MNRNVFTLTIGSLLLLIFGLLLCVFQVRQSEVAVVTTFSKPTRPITEPGAHWKLPWPIQRVHKFDQRIQTFEERNATEGLTSDSFNLVTSVYVGWKITDVAVFFPKFADSADPIAAAERGLELLLGNVRSGIISKHPLSDFLSVGDNGTNFVAIENEMLQAVQSQLRAYNYGLDLEFLGLKRVQLPQSVTETVFERMRAERKVLADQSQFQGEARAQEIRSEAERRAAELLAKANSEATRIRGEGEAEAAKSLTVFQQNPELAGFIFRLNALEGALKERSTLVFDQHTLPFDLFGRGVTNLLNK